MPAKVPMVPVKRDEGDHYRYKMQRVTSRTQSSGNGIKTAILNANTVAKAIYRQPGQICQWFGYALAVQAKPGQTPEQIFLNGQHDARKLQDSLYEFIDTFVICPACQNPETQMVNKEGRLCLHCKACGASTEPTIKTNYQQKMYDWLKSHITTETPKASGVTTQVKGKIDLIDEFQKSAASSEGTGQGVYINTEELAALLKAIEAPKQGGEQLSESDMDAYVDAFFTSFEKDCAGDVSDNELYKRFNTLAEKTKMNAASQINMLFQALFKSDSNLLQVIEKRRALLIRFLLSEKEQCDFLGLMGKFVCQDAPKLMTSAPVIWHCLFDNEVVEDAALKTWRKKTSRFEKDKKKAQELRDILKPFYHWLDEAPFEEVVEEEEVAEEEHKEEAKEDSDIDIDAI